MARPRHPTELREAVSVHSLAVYCTQHPNTAIVAGVVVDGRRTWTLRTGEVDLKEAYRLYAHYPLVP